MKTTIVYISKHGTTKSVAEKIAAAINDGETEIISLKENKNPDICNSQRIIIGGSIHAGMIQKKIKDFISNNIEKLLTCDVGLFICGMEKEKMQEQFNNAFPENLRNHALASMLPGGEFHLDRMNIIEKAIVKKVSGVTKNISQINQNHIQDFIRKMLLISAN